MTIATAYLGLGSNVGDRLESLRAALGALSSCPGVQVDREAGIASVFETQPIGGPAGQRDYLNTAVRIDTTLAPHELLAMLLDLEARLGRIRAPNAPANGPRVIDIDLLLHGRAVVRDAVLTVPHPCLHERRFVLEPLCEIAADVRHPVAGVTMAVLLDRLLETAGTDAPRCTRTASAARLSTLLKE